MQFDISKNWKGIIGTVLFHVFLFLILYFSYFDPAEPVFPDPEGITVNFGDDETGQSQDEPAQTSSAQEEVSQPVTEEAEVGPDADADVPTVTSEIVPNQVITQETEDAPAMEKQKLKEEKERKLKEEADRKTKEIAEAIKKEAERQKLETERIRKDAEQKQIEASNKRAKNVFGSGKTSSSTQGTTDGDGNQGKPSGDPNADNYNNGKGAGNGVDWSLDGRSAISVPRPSSGIQEEGKVVVEIIVDKAGNVVDARGGLIGSTTTDSRLVKLATEAASKAKFNVSPNSPERQKGKITYIFELK